MLMLVTPKIEHTYSMVKFPKLEKKTLRFYTKLAVLTASPTSWEIFISHVIFLLGVGLLFLKYQ